MAEREGRRWNHNIHFHSVVLGAVPAHASSALDVGTGDGMLAVELRRTLTDVVAIDSSEAVLNAAAKQHGGIEWVLGDVMTHDFGRTFDVVAAVAVVHHFPDLRRGLRRLAAVTSPGGSLVVVGLARAASVRDHLYGVAGVVQHRWYSHRRTMWEHSAPTVWPPPHTYNEARAAAAGVLPGAQWRQYPLWRYVLTWRKPAR
ncbi:class I SAM-dependent methyltransferase [Microbacterium sp. 4R-513]|uniref:class I SAM-dependent methyltransferase n=1 Tax=Microbacterium sp. 4R-513 TaxID=2567934 RepID=UPI001F493B09|nr:class I SAM-dependent methyltransferase [Microbacterium sp. 4R-513]